ncbi:hypothetical protein ACFYUK_13050 [Nonomuraea wenchangensis]
MALSDRWHDPDDRILSGSTASALGSASRPVADRRLDAKADAYQGDRMKMVTHKGELPDVVFAWTMASSTPRTMAMRPASPMISGVSRMLSPQAIR